jgi:hypothetical protein
MKKYIVTLTLCLTILQVLAQKHQKIVFSIDTVNTQCCRFESNDTFLIRIQWDFEKVNLSSHTKTELDSIIEIIKSLSIDKVNVYYWDYDYDCSAAFYSRKRSVFLYDYIDKNVLIDSMYVNHHFVSCERSSVFSEESFSRTLLIYATASTH